MKYLEKDLLPFADYEKIGHNLPLLIKHFNSKSELWYYAAVHSYDPQDDQFDSIRKAFNDSHPEIVILEGSLKINSDNTQRNNYFQRIKAADYSEIIRQKGEFGFALKLALENSIDVICPEPTQEMIINHLTKTYQPIIIMLSLIIEMVVQFQSMEISNVLLQKKLKDEFASIKKMHLIFSDILFEDILNTFELLTRQSLLSAEPELVMECNDPIPWSTKKYEWNILNSISQSTTNFRDIQIINVIKTLTSTHKRILIVYGGSHYFAQKSIISKLFVNTLLIRYNELSL